jgi:hypothetical protein
MPYTNSIATHPYRATPIIGSTTAHITNMSIAVIFAAPNPMSNGRRPNRSTTNIPIVVDIVDSTSMMVDAHSDSESDMFTRRRKSVDR